MSTTLILLSNKFFVHYINIMENHQKIKTLLKLRGEKHYTLGELLGLERTTVTRKLNGKTRFFEYELQKILNHFGILLEEFEAADTYSHLVNLYKASISEKPHYVWVPVLNYAQCGAWTDFTDLEFPVGIADRYEQAKTIDENAFFIIAKGDSMVGAGINEGDLLLVEPNKRVENGDIVLASIDGEKTVKRIKMADDHVLLHPMNPDFETIVITDPDKLEKLIVYRVSRTISEK